MPRQPVLEGAEWFQIGQLGAVAGGEDDPVDVVAGAVGPNDAVGVERGEHGLAVAVALHDAEEAGAYGSAHHAPTVPTSTHVINIDGAADLTDAATVEARGPAHALLAALDLGQPAA